MVKIGICDDRMEINEKYAGILAKIAKEESILMNVRTFNSADSLLFDMDDDMNEFDILYLDIEIGRANGIEVAKKLRKRGCKSILIFLTDNSGYVFKSFDVRPFQYLLKSEITYDKFKEILILALKEKTANDELFVCECQGKRKVEQLSNIRYFDVRNRIVSLHSIKGEFSFYAKLDTVQEQLNNRWFVRVHRSFIVNLYYVDKITSKIIVMLNGEELPIGSTYLKTLREMFSEFLLEKT